MKRISLCIVFVLIALLGIGCGPMIEGSGNVTTETRQVSNFSQVELAGIGDVDIVQGETEGLTIEAEDNLLPYIITEVQGDKLFIGFKTDTLQRVHHTKPVKYHLTMKTVTELQVRGSGNIQSERITGDQLQLTIAGSGNIAIDQLDVKTIDNTISGSGDLVIGKLETETAKTTISGSGKCVVSGKTSKQSAYISGSGNYQAFDLESQTASLRLVGSGDAETWVTETLDVNVTGSGNVQYYGAPSISQHVAGSGNVSGLGTH